MKFRSCLIIAFALMAGCSESPLIKSSDPARTPKEKPAPVPAVPAPADTVAAATLARPATGPGYIVNCNGTGRTLSSCFEQADEICELQKHFVSNILKIEESKSRVLVTRSVTFRCNTDINYGNVGFPDNAQVQTLKKKPSIQDRLLYGK